MANMKYLILGDRGFVGSGMKMYLSLLEKDILIYGGDLRKKSKELEEKIKQSDFVYFFAFDVGGSLFMNEYEKTYDFLHNNILIMDNVFSYFKKLKKKFIFTSNYITKDVDSIHGNVKLIGERYTNSLNGINVRLWNLYGGREKDGRSHVIHDFIKSGKRGNITVKTDGEEKRQFLYIKDCCKALYSLSENFNLINCDYYDITSFEWVKIKDVACMISKELNCELQFGNNKENNRIYYNPKEDIRRFWSPTTSLEEGIKKTIGIII